MFKFVFDFRVFDFLLVHSICTKKLDLRTAVCSVFSSASVAL